jgi:hypothetical protein
MAFLKLTAMYNQTSMIIVNADNIVSIQPSLEREGGSIIDTLKGPVHARESIEVVEAMLTQHYQMQGAVHNG